MPYVQRRLPESSGAGGGASVTGDALYSLLFGPIAGDSLTDANGRRQTPPSAGDSHRSATVRVEAPPPPDVGPEHAVPAVRHSGRGDD